MENIDAIRALEQLTAQTNVHCHANYSIILSPKENVCVYS